MNAANLINELNEVQRLRQVLKKNPNDIDAQLELVAKVKDPELKRKVLNRVLTLEPTNQNARDLLLELDRAKMGRGYFPSTPSAVSMPLNFSSEAIGSLDEAEANVLVLRYPIFHQILVFTLMAITFVLGVQAFLKGAGDVVLVMGAFLLFLIIPLWYVSVVVQLSDAGIEVSRLFGVVRREIPWGEILKIQSNSLGQGIKISTKEGKFVDVSAQLHGYPSFVEILRGIRPDLFTVTTDETVSMTGAKTFQKNFLAKYGLFFFLVPATPLAVGGIIVPPFLPGILISAVIFFLWRSALQAVYLIRMDQNRLSTRSFIKSREFSVQQITSIDIVTVYNRRGVAKSSVQLQFKDESQLTLSGFPEGNELLYGFLKNWWEGYQNN